MSSSGRSPAPPDSRRARRSSQRAARREAHDRDLARRRAAQQHRVSSTVWLTVAGAAIAIVVIAVFALSSQHAPVPSGIQPPSVTSPTGLADGRSLGSAGAPVTIDLWADFQCPYCAAFTQTVEPQLVTSYIATGKARLVFHDFAFIGPESTAAAVAATCAEQQGAFWPYHDYLYANQGAEENQGAFSTARLAQMATDVGLDTAAFGTCAADPTVLATVQQEHAQGTSAGVQGTPTIFVNGKRLANYDQATVTTAVDAALGNATPGPLPSESNGPTAGASS